MLATSYSAREEQLNVISHVLGLLIAIVGLVMLVAKADGALELTAVSIYGGSLILLFLASSLYHAVVQHSWKAGLKLFDHSAIYLLIAGTYTPILLVSFDGLLSLISMIVIWTLAAFGVGFKLLTGTRFPKVSLTTYLSMGWLSLALAYPMYQHIAAEGLWLLAAGGLLFSVGAMFYVAKHKPYTHAIWHLFVVAGCACHFATVYGYVI
ncbi:MULTISPECIES: PAQR family membrane homeostasis protein TrhA [unclassified Agarivorans]|uniref:PAQR family membrane homeostasis protein TrhA n=1 Tax=unclassified Agarivorans TaxID=2636026 RepID=UPI0026E455FC|nr:MULTISPECIES: hemolysin III family protein [unclassified Agarivorans]MDO6687867.1 hemolysin III family protein [Agarivorans sp. 3_MG-2023]MDO6717489.1 hemolysin III family protein [Agarivorans sp. 2_MG-2023]